LAKKIAGIAKNKKALPLPIARGAVARIIESDADIVAGMRALRRKCPHMRRIHDLAGDPPLRRRPPGFDGLARIVIGQQVSVASAAAIWPRFAAALGEVSASRVMALDDLALQGAGLSRPKVRTIRAIALAVAHDGLDLAGIADMDEATARSTLTAISGIGPWTTDVYLMFCVGAADVFAPGDLALQVAAEWAIGLKARPTADELAKIAERWRPWRGVAARMLWSYYAHEKAQRSGAPV
jgi:DNA-3-methyladenine glycosylase II